MELLRNILSTNLTHVQIFICCAVVLFLCFGFIIFTFFKLFLGVVSQANAEVEKKEALEEKVNLNQKDKKKDVKKKLILLFSIIGILGVVDWYSDKIPFMFDTASNTEMSFSVFLLLVACLGIFIIMGYIPYKLLKLMFTRVPDEDNKKNDGSK